MTVIQEEDPRWLGARHHSSATAEASAVAWALQWVIRRPGADRFKPAHIICDNLAIGNITKLMATPRANAEMGRVLQGLYLFAKMRCLVQVEWIKGHSLHPWNEMADAGAKWCRKNGGLAALPATGLKAWANLGAPDPEWAWLAEAKGELKRAYPPLVDGLLYATAAEHADLDVPDQARQAQVARRPLVVKLRVCSANVLTIRDKKGNAQEAGARDFGRMRQLLQLGPS